MDYLPHSAPRLPYFGDTIGGTVFRLLGHVGRRPSRDDCFDDSHPLKQMVWFLVILFPLLGASLYCFVVYSRSDVLKNVGAN